MEIRFSPSQLTNQSQERRRRLSRSDCRWGLTLAIGGGGRWPMMSVRQLSRPDGGGAEQKGEIE